MRMHVYGEMIVSLITMEDTVLLNSLLPERMEERNEVINEKITFHHSTSHNLFAVFFWDPILGR